MVALTDEVGAEPLLQSPAAVHVPLTALFQLSLVTGACNATPEGSSTPADNGTPMTPSIDARNPPLICLERTISYRLRTIQNPTHPLGAPRSRLGGATVPTLRWALQAAVTPRQIQRPSTDHRVG